MRESPFFIKERKLCVFDKEGIRLREECNKRDTTRRRGHLVPSLSDNLSHFQPYQHKLLIATEDGRKLGTTH